MNEIQETDQALERGHLAPRGDFFYSTEQEATFYYVNVVPMWKSINRGNWNRLELSVRHLAINKRKILQVWTGAWGILKLKDAWNQPMNVVLESKNFLTGKIGKF